MGKRVRLEDPLWILCCCGGIPIFGLLKAIIAVIPQIFIVTVPCFVLSILHLPKDVMHAYWTLYATRRLGPNIKVMAMLILPIFFILWPVFVLVGAFLLGAFTGLAEPIISTFDDNQNLFYGGIYETWRSGVRYVEKFMEMNDQYFIYLQDYREYNLDGEPPFDIRIIDIFVGLIIALIGSLLDGLGFTLIGVVKLIPCIVKCYIELWKFYSHFSDGAKMAAFIFFILANALVPVFAVLLLAICIIGGLGIGVTSAYWAYKVSIVCAFGKIWNNIVKLDEVSNGFIFDKERSCLICFGNDDYVPQVF